MIKSTLASSVFKINLKHRPISFFEILLIAHISKIGHYHYIFHTPLFLIQVFPDDGNAKKGGMDFKDNKDFSYKTYFIFETYK